MTLVSALDEIQRGHQVTSLARVPRVVNPRAECPEPMLDVMDWVRMSPSWEVTNESRGVQEPRPAQKAEDPRRMGDGRG